jgi:hypothetical protein
MKLKSPLLATGHLEGATKLVTLHHARNGHSHVTSLVIAMLVPAVRIVAIRYVGGSPMTRDQYAYHAIIWVACITGNTSGCSLRWPRR